MAARKQISEPAEKQEVKTESVVDNASNAIDDIKPLVLLNSGPRLGPVIYLPSNEVSFMWASQQSNQVGIPHPLAVKVTKQGGAYHKLEFFYPISKDIEISLEKFDDKFFVLKLGKNPETGKIRGKKYGPLVCTGWARDNCKELSENEKYNKYVCLTDQINHVMETPTHLKWLGTPAAEN